MEMNAMDEIAAEGRRNVVVTGAGGSLARHLVESLAQNGFAVHAAVHSPSQVDLYSGIRHVRTGVMDVLDADSVSDYCSQVIGRSGGLYGLINCAGYAVQGPLELMTREEFQNVIGVNVGGVLQVTNALLPALRAYTGPGKARVLNISAGTARTAVPMFGLVSASKSALDSISAAYRIELGRWGIRVTSVALGATESAIHEKSGLALMRAAERSSEISTAHYGATIEKLLARLDGYTLMNPAHAARQVIDIFEKPNPRGRYIVGRDARVLAGIAVLPDSLRDRMMAVGMGIE
ncbi:SDR family NAD(P)-dependent oxidoreductase [Nocardia sp. CA-136227]|uniref:SDR family NAD(P)-dependent oxidoreductase n=1 Tax=Nocardia sp. CA-136227 TaxID=3239979 RepID=UPI003D95BBCB